MGVLTVFFDVSYQSYLPSLVDRDQLVEGNAKLQASQSAAQILGPGLGGYLIGVLTAPIAVIVDAVSYARLGPVRVHDPGQRGADPAAGGPARQPRWTACAASARRSARASPTSSVTPTCG